MKNNRYNNINSLGTVNIIGLPKLENKEGKLQWNYSISPWMIERSYGRDFLFEREGKCAKLLSFKAVKSLSRHMFVRHVDDTTGDFKTSRFYLIDKEFIEKY